VNDLVLAVRNLSVQHRRRLAFRGVSFELRAGQALGIAGANGAGKSTLLRALFGGIRPSEGEIRIGGRVPRDALARTPTAYFAGEATLPGFARASAWGSLGTGEEVTSETRRIRTLPRGVRQLLGLRTELGRHPLSLVILDEPWEGLDPDAARWLNATLEAKRDRGAAVVVSSRRLEDLAGICDKYLLLTSYAPFLLSAHDIEPVGAVSAARLSEVFDKIRAEPTAALVRLHGRLSSRSPSQSP
jgi:ABC-type multidrug transport system ATPase subunit